MIHCLIPVNFAITRLQILLGLYLTAVFIVMLPYVPFHNIKTPGFTLRSVTGYITHCLPGTVYDK